MRGSVIHHAYMYDLHVPLVMLHDYLLGGSCLPYIMQEGIVTYIIFASFQLDEYFCTSKPLKACSHWAFNPDSSVHTECALITIRIECGALSQTTSWGSFDLDWSCQFGLVSKACTWLIAEVVRHNGWHIVDFIQHNWVNFVRPLLFTLKCLMWTQNSSIMALCISWYCYFFPAQTNRLV